MKISKGIAKHILLMLGITLILILCILYPFLPGEYDPLAVPLSTMVQVFGVVGLPLVVIGVLWLIVPGRGFFFGFISMIVGGGVALILSLIATFSVGNAFGILTLAIWIYFVIQLVPKVKHLKDVEGSHFNIIPLYLVTLPVLTLISQLILAKPVTEWSKRHSVTNANEFIADIEKYYFQHGTYPLSLQAQHKDYKPDVVGVEKYCYGPQGNGYNLFFEQPRFFFDRFGTREWMVYNPRDEHRVYSHVAWLLLTSELSASTQGWYASGNTRFLHWKYFLFD